MLPVVSFILRNIASLCFAVQFWRKNGTIMQQCPVANSRLIDFASREVGKFADSRLSVANFATFGTTLVASLLLYCPFLIFLVNYNLPTSNAYISIISQPILVTFWILHLMTNPNKVYDTTPNIR